jgi:hypothetical protein
MNSQHERQHDSKDELTDLVASVAPELRRSRYYIVSIAPKTTRSWDLGLPDRRLPQSCLMVLCFSSMSLLAWLIYYMQQSREKVARIITDVVAG